MNKKTNYKFQIDQFPSVGGFASISFVLCFIEKFNEMPFVHLGNKKNIWEEFFFNPKLIEPNYNFNIHQLYQHCKNNFSPRPKFKNEIISPSNEQRLNVNKIIDKYLILKNKEIIDSISKFKKDNFKNSLMGVHIRSQKKYDVHLKNICKIKKTPIDLFVDYINNSNYDNIFLCSDSKEIKTNVKKRIKKNVIEYNSFLSKEGETHKEFKEMQSKTLKEALIESYLLTHTDFFLHGISNMSNFVLFKNPKLPNKDILYDFLKK